MSSLVWAQEPPCSIPARLVDPDGGHYRFELDRWECCGSHSLVLRAIVVKQKDQEVVWPRWAQAWTGDVGYLSSLQPAQDSVDVASVADLVDGKERVEKSSSGAAADVALDVVGMQMLDSLWNIGRSLDIFGTSFAVPANTHAHDGHDFEWKLLRQVSWIEEYDTRESAAFAACEWPSSRMPLLLCVRLATMSIWRCVDVLPVEEYCPGPGAPYGVFV